jgi:hypothetical protein
MIKSYHGCINGHFTNLNLDLNSICNETMLKIINSTWNHELFKHTFWHINMNCDKNEMVLRKLKPAK